MSDTTTTTRTDIERDIDADALPTLATESPASKPPVLSLRERILAANDITVESLYVPEWDATLSLRTMTGAARAAMLASAADPTTGDIDYNVLYPQVIIATCVDPDTMLPIFTQPDVDLLNQKSGAALERVAQAGMKVSGMTGEAEKALGNDSSSPNGGSTSS